MFAAAKVVRCRIPATHDSDIAGGSSMAGARSFTELQNWQRARVWSRDIFHATQKAPFARDQRLVVQINDSSESVMSNIAEGFGRGTQEEFITFLGYAMGSLDETQSHLVAAYDRGYLSKEKYAILFREGTAIRKLTVGFIRAMILPRGGVRTLGKRPNWSDRTWEIYERVTGKPRPAIFDAARQPSKPARNDQPPV
ncbi:MAG TPA: four helix bundle protein [Gemmataceae bacterium]